MSVAQTPVAFYMQESEDLAHMTWLAEGKAKHGCQVGNRV